MFTVAQDALTDKQRQQNYTADAMKPPFKRGVLLSIWSVLEFRQPEQFSS
jgi:hypothetical protein